MNRKMHLIKPVTTFLMVITFLLPNYVLAASEDFLNSGNSQNKCMGGSPVFDQSARDAFKQAETNISDDFRKNQLDLQATLAQDYQPIVAAFLASGDKATYDQAIKDVNDKFYQALIDATKHFVEARDKAQGDICEPQISPNAFGPYSNQNFGLCGATAKHTPSYEYQSLQTGGYKALTQALADAQSSSDPQANVKIINDRYSQIMKEADAAYKKLNFVVDTSSNQKPPKVLKPVFEVCKNNNPFTYPDYPGSKPASSANSNDNSSATSPSSKASCLSSALKDAKNTYLQALKVADLAYSHALQEVQSTYNQALKDANTAYKNALANAKNKADKMEAKKIYYQAQKDAVVARKQALKLINTHKQLAYKAAKDALNQAKAVAKNSCAGN